MFIRINSNILKGNEIMIGGSIIIFIVMSVFVIIMFMIRNGMKIMNFIWNVVFNLLIVYVGIMIVIGMFWYVFGFLVWLYFINSSRFFFFVWENINFLMGFCVFLSVFVCVMFFLR